MHGIMTLRLCSNFKPQVVKEDLGRPWTDVYAELTPEPIAAASLGQVSMCDCII